ncbi:unnamed protein product [Sphagnum troendelagicum]|uniref:COBRA-like protein n=1 Tax=Sphagnum troendelagicum TaxID=128251 RepID=A0ABP0TD30_9BRYO
MKREGGGADSSFSSAARIVKHLCFSCIATILILFSSTSHNTWCVVAFDSLDPNANITIKWDVMTWASDGYIASVTLFNWQQYRHIELPGWILSWTWASKEVIWTMLGAEAMTQGDCSQFHSDTPHSCARNPSIVDLLPGVPYNQQVANCCRGGVLASFAQDPANAVAAFQITVGRSGNTNTTVKLPKNFALKTPGPGYTCGPAVKVAPSLFLTKDGRRHTQAFMTWTVTCTYSQYLAHKAPSCCVSLSTFYDTKIVPCVECACACSSTNSSSAAAAASNTRYSDLPSISSSSMGVNNQQQPDTLYCTRDMCPVKIHWHVKTNYQQYWRVKITITNRDFSRNFTQWTLVLQHPNFSNFTQAFSFNYKALSPYASFRNDSAVFWGIKYFNDMLMAAGPSGNVQSELLFQKTKAFKFNNGWALPHRVYFNGDDCVLPDLQDYPSLPNSGSSCHLSVHMFRLILSIISTGASVLIFSS